MIKIIGQEYYGKPVQILRISDGQEWINGAGLDAAIKHDLAEGIQTLIVTKFSNLW